MGVPPKAPPVYKPVPPRLAASRVHRPSQAPIRQLKPANNFRLETRPAPPVYRPQPVVTQPRAAHRGGSSTHCAGPATVSHVQSGVQPKPVNNFRLETRPAPPVYLPEEIQSGVQPKAANNFRVEKSPAPKVPMPTSAVSVERLGIQTRRMTSAVTSGTGIAGSQRAGVLQRSCWPWCCPSSDKQTAEEERELVPKAQQFEDNSPILLQEGQSRMVEAGDKVRNHGVTSCGLVLAFGSEGILAYHWPFMSLDHSAHFSKLVEKVGTLKKIEIYTNPMPSSESKSKYQLTLRNIRYNYTKKTRHYIYGTELKGDVTVTLNADGVERCEPAVTDELLPG